MVGIDVEELLAGARFMDQRLKAAAPTDNPAYRLAALYYLFAPKATEHPGDHALCHDPDGNGGLVLPALGREPGEKSMI